MRSKMSSCANQKESCRSSGKEREREREDEKTNHEERRPQQPVGPGVKPGGPPGRGAHPGPGPPGPIKAFLMYWCWGCSMKLHIVLETEAANLHPYYQPTADVHLLFHRSFVEPVVIWNGIWFLVWLVIRASAKPHWSAGQGSMWFIPRRRNTYLTHDIGGMVSAGSFYCRCIQFIWSSNLGIGM